MLRERIDGDNGNIRIALSGPTKEDPAHGFAVGNNHPLEPSRDERHRVNELVRHRRRIGAYCSRVFLLRL
jgi:hypothetical protein